MRSLRPSAAFLHREVDGEDLLSELNELREGQVAQRQLVEIVARLKPLRSLSFVEGSTEIRRLLDDHSNDAPRLAALVRRWAQRLRVDDDVPMLVAHFERLMLSSAILPVIRSGAARLYGAHEGE